MNNLLVKVVSKEHVRKRHFYENFSFSNKEPIVTGSIEIQNPNEAVESFSTKMLEASFDKTTAVRTYNNGIESNVVDFSQVEVGPKSTLKYKVVWYPNLKIGTKLSSAEFKCY